MRIEQVRLLVLKTAWLMDTVGNRGARIEVSAIKVAAPEVATWVIDRAIQAHGGAGVSQDSCSPSCTRSRGSCRSPTVPTRSTTWRSLVARVNATGSPCRSEMEVLEMQIDRPAQTGEARIRCVVCQTHSRPLYVPWQQHALGCPVRAADLGRRELELRPPLPVVSSIAAF